MRIKVLSLSLLVIFVFGQSTRIIAAGLNSAPVDAEVLLSNAVNELGSLDELEAMVLADEDLSLSDVNLEAYNLDYTNYESNIAGIAGIQESPLGIPSFFWGFCLGWVGLLIVFLMNDGEPDKKEEVKKALIGCAISTVVGVVIYVVIIAAAASSASTASSSF